MTLLRSILAVLFAITLANPACCCTWQSTAEPAHHCCGGGKKKEQPHDGSCLCAAKQVKKLEDPATLPAFTASELPALDECPLPPARPTFHSHPAIQPGVVQDTGPPRIRLIRYQRFLI
jgi:hypothetical protein